MCKPSLIAAVLTMSAAMTDPLLASTVDQTTAESAANPATVPVTAGEGRAVAAKLAGELVNDFVYREQAERYAAMLRKNAAAGRYDAGTRGAVARLMTDDLMAVQQDGHLAVHVTQPEDKGPNRGPSGLPPLIQSAREIAPGIAYIRFSAFFGTDEELAGVRKFLADNRDARTLIFDLRNHHGGGLEEQDLIFSAIFDKTTPLVKLAMAKSIYDRHGSPFGEARTVRFVTEGDKIVATHSAIPDGDTALRRAQVLVLTSNRTGSAAEHFALALKSSGRGTLIGEATAGANHFGGPAELNEHFNVWMPVGRTYDIATGKDWEGDGVAPDVVVDPKQALMVALEKAGLSHAEALKIDAQEVPAEPVHSDKGRAR